MSFESANFVFWPETTPISGWGLYLLNHGAEPHPTGGNTEQFALRGSEYWIDFQIVPSNSHIKERISIRMALCNPEPAFERLLKSLRNLLEEGGGVIVDQGSHSKIRTWTDTVESDLRTSYLEQQQRFRSFFGDRRAAIPADSVFEQMREKPDRP